MDSKKRNVAMDIIRCFALFFVISVHFFLKSGYYSQTITGKNMLFLTIIRSFFIICVPLFMILSGYLMNNKKLNKKYYLGIIKILGIYVLASIACLLYKKFFLHHDITIINSISKILNFSAANYSWYIEMYIGLFLLIPFINIIYNNLDSKRDKQILIITFLILTALPGILNIFNLTSKEALITPSISTNYHKIFPNWWQSIYPLTYYFIGCYIKKYKININKILNIFLLIISTILFGLFCYYRSYNSTFIWGSWQNYGSLPIIIISTLFFILIDNIDFSNCPNFINKIFKHISNLALGAYLVSYIFDDIFYKKLITNVPNFEMRFNYYFIIVPIIFICSILLSLLINIIYKILVMTSIKIINKLKKKSGK